MLGSFPHAHQSYSLTSHAIVVGAYDEARTVVPDFEAPGARLVLRTVTQASLAPEWRATLFKASWTIR